MSVENLITKHIDIWTSAVQTKSTAGRGTSSKLDLYGIKKLRELILELAVRGKLVPQDSLDEEASILLKRASEQKGQLVELGLIKKPRKLDKISEDEIPFDVPKTWVWTRIENVGHDLGQKKPDASFTYIDVSAINKELGLIEDANILNASEAPSRARKLVKKGTVIYSTVRPYLLNIAVIDHDISPEPIASTAFAIIHPLDGISSSYIYRYLRSPSFISYVESVQNGIAYPAINDKQFFNGLIPIPPQEEQHRIVAKVDELMVLCDQLEQQTEASIEAHQVLVETLLATLTNSADADELMENWERISAHFDTLFTTEESIDQLKQTILQLAVMGKLVPQDPKDEPASVLLERIAKEKAQLVKDKKIKKQKPYVTFEGLDSLMKDLPFGWKWVRLADIAEIVRGGSPRPAGDPRYYDGDIPFLKVGDVTRKSSKFVEGFNATIKEAGLQKTRLIETRTVLLSNSGATLGIPAICEFPATFNDGIAAFINKSEFIFDEYLYLYLNTMTDWFLNIASRGQGQPNLNTDIIKATRFPLAPIKEQYRIVAKVDSLIDMCNQLKLRIAESQTVKLNLTDAIVDQAL